MELSLEACYLVVGYVNNRADICTLCSVSKTFRAAAERALYNTLFMGGSPKALSLCGTLISQPRVARFVRALTIHLAATNDAASRDSDSNDGDGDGEGEDSSGLLPEGYWSTISSALKCTVRLQHLNIHINDDSDAAIAWIFDGCVFQLRNFHCDLQWDKHLISFLDRQPSITDLYLVDYVDSAGAPSAEQALPSSTQGSIEGRPEVPLKDALDPRSLPRLTLFESTFTEAAAAIVPNRPVTHIKTCISRPDLAGKKAEVSHLFANLGSSKRRICSVDLSDESYSEATSREILQCVVRADRVKQGLKYLGTVVLPINGQERLRFYGYLRKLSKLRCLEVEISNWNPPPTTLTAFRALARELGLYCRAIDCVVFVQEDDRTVMLLTSGRWELDAELNTDTLWREV